MNPKASSKSAKTRPVRKDLPGSFEVKVVRSLGIVSPDPNGFGTPYAAALSLIAKDGDDGEYRFELPDGPNVTVRIEFDPPTVTPYP